MGSRVLITAGWYYGVRMALRQDNSKPIFNDLEDWLHAQLPKISGKSPLAQAIRYALNCMPKTRPYLDNGFLELDKILLNVP
jgi:transposase